MTSTAASEAGLAATPAETALEDPNSRVVIAGQILCILVPLAIWFAPLGLEPVTQHALAIVGFMVVAWITRAMDYALAGLVGCFLFWALRIVAFPVAFSGFANDTAWFLFGALLLGTVATRSGVCSQDRLFHHAADWDHVSQDIARPDRHRLPADLHRPIRHRPRCHHGVDCARSCRGIQIKTGK